jgi:Calcineurin-like phosphoesterase
MSSQLFQSLIYLALAVGLTACGGGGGSPSDITSSTTSTSAPTQSSVDSVTQGFAQSILLAAPTDSSIRISVLSPMTGVLTLAYQANLAMQAIALQAGIITPDIPREIYLSDLKPNTRYTYTLSLQTGTSTLVSPTYSFTTARTEGSSFTFTLQADSHLDENSDLDVYKRTLANVLLDLPDFHIDLGDTFMTEKHSEPLSATLQAATSAMVVNKRYLYERYNFGLITHSVPLFLVNGNHDGELGWLLNGTPNALPIWATTARQTYFSNPQANAFYLGDNKKDPFTGERSSWYAWHWGDALFVVLDPFWNSPLQSNKDGWNLTLGSNQYQWLSKTLSESKAKHKIIFIHNLVGGLDGQMRGGIEAAPYFEWGGKNLDGSPGFSSRRPGWELPIHELLVKHQVKAVFHGHDHLYAQQSLDGIIYQTVPQPSAKNFNSGTTLARDYHYDSGVVLSSSGHLRIKVTPTSISSEYVRSWLPSQENPSRKNRQVDASW